MRSVHAPNLRTEGGLESAFRVDLGGRIKRPGVRRIHVEQVVLTPWHVYMLQRSDLFPSIPLWALWLRLPIQVALLALIAWCTAPVRRDDNVLSYYRVI